MKIKEQLLQVHSKANSLKIVDYVGVNPDRFKELVSLYLEGPYRLTQRASWPLTICVERHPDLVAPHLKAILQHTMQPDMHNAVKRNTVRLLQFIDIPKKLEGEVLTMCLHFLEGKKTAVAIKAFSLTVLSKIVKDKPDLQREIEIMIEDQLPYATPGFVSRATKTLRGFRARDRQ